MCTEWARGLDGKVRIGMTDSTFFICREVEVMEHVGAHRRAEVGLVTVRGTQTLVSFA